MICGKWGSLRKAARLLGCGLVSTMGGGGLNGGDQLAGTHLVILVMVS